MRRVLHFLVILYYVASSYAVSQERTSLIVSELHHSSSRQAQTQIDTGCTQLHAGLPNYRHAKPKSICALEFAPVEKTYFLPQVSSRVFQFQSHSLKSLYSIESILYRGPPSI